MEAEKSHAVKLLLEMTRSKIRNGDTNEAFSALLHAICLVNGESAILEILDTAKREVESHEHSADEIENLHKAMKALLKTSSLLKEQGSEDILRDAFEDGSSVICTLCGDLIARNRWEAHKIIWCSAISD